MNTPNWKALYFVNWTTGKISSATWYAEDGKAEGDYRPSDDYAGPFYSKAQAMAWIESMKAQASNF